MWSILKHERAYMRQGRSKTLRSDRLESDGKLGLA